MHRGEIWLIDLGLTVGDEIKKTRPAVIINDDAIGILPLKIIVPITDWESHYSKALWMVKTTKDLSNKLAKDSAIDTFQIRSISEKRFVSKLGTVSDPIITNISNALARVLGISI